MKKTSARELSSFPAHHGSGSDVLTEFALSATTTTLVPADMCTLLDPNNGGRLNDEALLSAPPSSRSRLLCLQCLSYRMPNSTTKYSTNARNTNSVHDISHTSMHFSSSALGELFLLREKKKQRRIVFQKWFISNNRITGEGKHAFERRKLGKKRFGKHIPRKVM